MSYNSISPYYYIQQPWKLTCKECSNLPVAMYDAHTAIIEGKIYVGGGTVNDYDNKYGVHCYDPQADKWTTLPPAPVRYFGLGRINNQLVTVGGMKRDERCTDELYVFNERLLAWQQLKPNMPTATKESTVLSLESIMAVYSIVECDKGTFSEVNILRLDTMQWYKGANQLPGAPCYNMSMLTIACEKKCYILGGHKGHERSNKVYCALLEKGNDNTIQENNEIRLNPWKQLRETPSYQPAAAEIAGNLCIVGGWSNHTKGETIKAMYIYSPERDNNWAYIGNLQEPRSEAAIAAVSNMSFYVIGGRNKCGQIVRTVYMCNVEYM